MTKRAKTSQAEMTRMLKAARAAGFENARLITYPDGRIEVAASNNAAMITAAKNEWDEVL